MKKERLSYLLGCAACFLVVLVVALMISVLSHTPVVFLRLAEMQERSLF